MLNFKSLIFGLVTIVLTFFSFAAIADDRPPTRWAIPSEVPFNPAVVDKVYDVAVVGGGASGTVAAYTSAYLNEKVLFAVGGKKNIKQARGMWVREFNNMPVLDTLPPVKDDVKTPVVALRNEAIKNVWNSPQKDNLDVLEKSIDTISKQEENHQTFFVLTDSDGEQYKAKYIILATGIMDIQPLVDGSIKPILPFANTQQAIYCLRCDGQLASDKKNVIIFGHSDSAASAAILLKERYSIPSITILTNGEKPDFTDESCALLKHFDVKINIKAVTEINDKKSKTLTDIGFSDDSHITADFAVVLLGTRINNALAKQLGAELDPDGYVIGNEDGLTSVNDLFVSGDLKAGSRKQIYIAWDSAIRASEAINRRIREQKRKALNLTPVKCTSEE